MRDFVDSLAENPAVKHSIMNDRRTQITKLDCHDTVVKAFHKYCFNFNTVSAAIIDTILRPLRFQKLSSGPNL